MSYGLCAESGHERVELGRLAVDRIGGCGVRCRLEIVLRQEREQVARVVEHRLLVGADEMRHARAGRVRGRAAELLLRHLLAGDRLHDVGPGDEHVRRPLGHQHEVRDRRRVDGAAGARPEDQRDLRHHARRLDVPPEDLCVAGERDDALLDPRAARVVDPDDRAADLDGHVHHLADLLREHLAQRAAEHGEVLREHADRPAEHRPVAGHDGVTPGALLAHPELDLTVAHETVELDERARVEQPLDALPREQLPARMLLRGRLLHQRPQQPRRSAPRASGASPRSCRASSGSSRPPPSRDEPIAHAGGVDGPTASRRRPARLPRSQTTGNRG